MKKILIINFLFIVFMTLINAHETKLANLNGIDFLLQDNSSLFFKKFPLTFKERISLFCGRDMLSIAGTAGIAFCAIKLSNILARYIKEPDEFNPFNENTMIYSGIMTSCVFAISNPLVIKWDNFLEKISSAPIALGEINKAKDLLKNNIEALSWVDKKISDFFIVNDDGCTITCQDENSFLNSLYENEQNSVFYIELLKNKINPTLRKLIIDLDNLSLRFNEDNYQFVQLNSLVKGLNNTSTIIENFLDISIEPDDE